MDSRTKIANNNNKVRLGFGSQTDNYLRRFDNAAADPDVQVFTNETEDDEQTLYYCAMCKSRLEYHKHLCIFICPECFEQYDTKIQDRPILKKGFKITPHHELNRYPKFDDQDPNIPYMKGVSLDEQLDSDIEVLRTSQDGRIQHLRIRDNCTREEAYNKTRNL